MKTILLILALAGFTATGSYAQSTKNCTCKHKATNHKIAATHLRKASPVKNTAILPEPVLTVATTPASCYMYRKGNIVVTECPGIFYGNDGNGVFEYGTDGSYLGYYPISNPSGSGYDNGKCIYKDENENRTDLTAPQHTTIDHYSGVAPAGGNYCTYCTPQ